MLASLSPLFESTPSTSNSISYVGAFSSPIGFRLNGPADLRQAILKRPEAFVTIITQRMMTYALGRGLEPADMPAAKDAAPAAKEGGK